MILTPIPRDRLDDALDRFAAQLDDPAARAGVARIRVSAGNYNTFSDKAIAYI